MARKLGPLCRLCRREGIKLFLKGTRCDTAKCSVSRRDYPPGQHAWRRRKISDYGLGLREKQKVKRFYGLMEQQFRLYFKEAQRLKANTGENLLILLERRLDNVVARLGFALSHREARQLVSHGHMTVNGKKVNIPSYLVSPGDVITPASKEKTQKTVRENLELTKDLGLPSWLERSTEPLQGRVLALPNRDDVPIPVQEQLIVEFCSKG
ncbi:MAG: 30S ribosomal protein S4 [Planctomycetes bacterium DG_23]|nr:MAG: 30S ribosomal protein S4 [Planctomycetes bacterium DG_23]